METTETLRMMIERSGKSALSVGQTLGHGQSWAYMSTKTGRDPKLSTVAAVASVTGHEVAILDAGSGDVVAVIDPPERPEGEPKGKGEGKA